jgi:hypothetical protein
MIQIVYASAAVIRFTPAELTLLLDKARIRNATYSVTGMLVYHNGSFLQILEGPEFGVDRIYASIQRDSRHNSLKLLLRKTILRREFEDWSMAFIDTSSWPQNKSGQIDYLKMLPQLTGVPTAAGRYLRLFQQGLCRQTAPE